MAGLDDVGALACRNHFTKIGQIKTILWNRPMGGVLKWPKFQHEL